MAASTWWQMGDYRFDVRMVDSYRMVSGPQTAVSTLELHIHGQAIHIDAAPTKVAAWLLNLDRFFSPKAY